jgi:hypothetical protein
MGAESGLLYRLLSAPFTPTLDKGLIQNPGLELRYGGTRFGPGAVPSYPLLLCPFSPFDYQSPATTSWARPILRRNDEDENDDQYSS